MTFWERWKDKKERILDDDIIDKIEFLLAKITSSGVAEMLVDSISRDVHELEKDGKEDAKLNMANDAAIFISNYLAQEETDWHILTPWKASSMAVLLISAIRTKRAAGDINDTKFDKSIEAAHAILTKLLEIEGGGL